MSNPLRWDPLRELGTLRENMNRILEEGLASFSGTTLALDMYETDTTIVVETSPIPGARPEDIEVSITGNTLTIQGKSRQGVPSDETSGTYLRKERRFGNFSRSVTIPRPVKAEEASASFKDGMLTITIPKTEEVHPRVINIETTEDSPE